MTDVHNTDPYVTFEVTIPRDSDGIAALRGMATALGWPTRQRATLPSDLATDSLPKLWCIEDDHFLDASRELWETDDYGIAAIKRLQQLRHSVGGGLWSDGRVNMRATYELGDTKIDNFPLHSLYSRDEDGLRPNPNVIGWQANQIPEADLVKRAQILWERSYYPFAMRTHTSSDVPPVKYMQLSPGEITKDYLVNYVRGNGYDRHALHGTLGKMFDTISAVAGVVEKADIGERDLAREFIERQELVRMMKESDLHARSSNIIHNKVANAIEDQLASGQPYRHGEVILEGKSAGWNYDRIAVSSLGAIAHAFKKPKGSHSARFLQQFV